MNFKPGDMVLVPWGLDDVFDVVVDVFGPDVAVKVANGGSALATTGRGAPEATAVHRADRVGRMIACGARVREVASKVATRLEVSIGQRDGLRRTTAVPADRTDG